MDALVERHHERAQLRSAADESVEHELRRGVTRVAGGNNLVAALALGIEQCAVRRGEQRLEGFAVLGCSGYANG